MLVDSHCHLEYNDNLKNIIETAHKAGVDYILDAGSGLNGLNEHLKICQEFDSVYTAAGAHPHEAKEYQNITVDDIVKAADNDKVIAIGEAGLDYFYDFAPRELQIELFEKNIKASQITGKPLIIHNRESDEDMIRLLKNAYDEKEFKAVVHCYSSSWALAKEALNMGFYISASGIITFGKSEEIRDNFAKIPLDRLLVETDAPYLAPVPKRGKVNEPANVVFTAQKLAEIKNIDFEKLAEITTKNFKRLFKI
ncbi:MAG: TatD family deoxyribonuclease [Alphaproteobacteria bacterium]|nr:TatD family deoxyribonuclease [Alphaproteobacteria bacterium]